MEIPRQEEPELAKTSSTVSATTVVNRVMAPTTAGRRLRPTAAVAAKATKVLAKTEGGKTKSKDKGKGKTAECLDSAGGEPVTEKEAGTLDLCAC